jgi:16S rRNA (guanine966-N2)-methyltransferase
MRIIAGTHRSRVILPPPNSDTTRPITDRVKQALFDRLITLEAFGGNALDIFAGTGSLGLEVLSRETDHCVFVERDRRTRSVLERNVTEMGFDDRATVLGVDACSTAWLSLLPKRPIRLVFLDPPYAMLTEPRDVDRLRELFKAILPVMEEAGTLVLRTQEFTEIPTHEGWDGPVTYKYGSMNVSFYTKPAAAIAEG